MAAANGTNPKDEPVAGNGSNTTPTARIPVTVTITGNSNTVRYNGTTWTVTGYTAESSNPLYNINDIVFSGNATVSGRTAGTYPMGLTAEQFANRNSSFDVTFTVTDGSLVIEPALITITGGPDGTYTVTGLMPGDRVDTITVTANQMANGNISNVPSNALIRNADGENVTGSYVIRYVNGIQRPEPAAEQYRLTIRYWIGEVGGERAADDFTALYANGAAYSVTSPTLPGYSTESTRITGTIGEETTLDVIYTTDEYELTIYYVFNDGSEARPTYRRTMAYGQEYAVLSPLVENHTVTIARVTGIMPARNLTVTVRYLTNDEIIIEDYETPLGIQNMSMSTGETYE